jgi:hypothetical protein
MRERELKHMTTHPSPQAVKLFYLVFSEIPRQRQCQGWNNNFDSMQELR